MNSSHKLYTVSVVAGVATHYLFKRHEPTRNAFLPYLVLLAFEPLALSIYFNELSSFPVLFSYTIFYFSLVASVIRYRLSSSHPLADIPGPTIFKVTKLWRAYLCFKGQQHHVLKALHDEYGTVVRTGPNEISVIDVDSMKNVLGPGGLPKGLGYQVRRDERTEGSLLDLVGDAHAARRRIWNRGMSTESLREYESIISRHALQLADALSDKGTVDLGRWLGYFTLDFMADMAFGGTSGPKMMENGADDCGIMSLIEEAAKTSEILTHIPWVSMLPGYQAILTTNIQRMLDLGQEWSNSRVSTGAKTKDLWYHLTDEAGLESSPPSLTTVTGDSAVAIVAGSDTTAGAMSTLFWFLMSHPECYKRLQKEVDEVYPAHEDPLDTSKHNQMKYLGACINESLRLLPPVPSAGPRTVPKGTGGRVVAGHFLPEGTNVYIPPYSVHRRAYHFYPATDEFVPDRWLVDPKFNPSSNAPSFSTPPEEGILNYEAFIPFSYGPANCVGKNLARREIMMVMILLMQKFEFKFREGFEWEMWLENVRDYFVCLRTPLEVEIGRRC